MYNDGPDFEELDTLEDLDEFINQRKELDEVGGGTVAIFVLPEENPDVRLKHDVLSSD